MNTNTYIVTDPENWIVIADCHFKRSSRTKELTKLLTANWNSNIIFLGDTISAHYSFEQLAVDHSDLVYEIFKHSKVLFINGNNDPYISKYDKVLVPGYAGSLTWTLRHGHRLPKWVCSIFNLFKGKGHHSYVNIKRGIFGKIDRMLNGTYQIVGHFHKEILKDTYKVLAPGKIYKLSDLIGRI